MAEEAGNGRAYPLSKESLRTSSVGSTQGSGYFSPIKGVPDRGWRFQNPRAPNPIQVRDCFSPIRGVSDRGQRPRDLGKRGGGYGIVHPPPSERSLNRRVSINSEGVQKERNMFDAGLCNRHSRGLFGPGGEDIGKYRPEGIPSINARTEGGQEERGAAGRGWRAQCPRAPAMESNYEVPCGLLTGVLYVGWF